MAGKKAKSELESIRTELNELTEAIYALRQHVAIENAASAALRSNGAGAAAPRGDVGTVDISGSIQIPRGADQDVAFEWSSQGLPVRHILAQDHEQPAKILAAIGHRQRLAILNAILTKPSSAADLVTDLQLGTTGAAYHHLNVLQSAELVTQEERGIFAVNPQRVATLVTILASTTLQTTIGSPRAEEEAVAAAEPKRKSRKKGDE